MRRATHVRSAPFWHAVRLTAASLTGTVLFRVTNPGDGFWIPEAALFVMRPDKQLTRRRAVLRIIGSVAGAALTTLVPSRCAPTRRCWRYSPCSPAPSPSRCSG